MAPLGCSAVARLQRWFRGHIAAEGPVGGGSWSILSVYMFSITFTHLIELLALGGRRSEALPFVRVNVRLSLVYAVNAHKCRSYPTFFT